MATTSITAVPFSRYGLATNSAIDVTCLSDRARRWTETRRVVIATAAGQKQTAVFTQNATVKHNLGCVGQPAYLRAAYLSCETLAAGGTLTSTLVAYDASANGEVTLTSAVNPEGMTVREGTAFTLAATNVALDADDTIELHNAASNDAVSQDGQGFAVTLVWEAVEATAPTKTSGV